jgi:hypothetical protein
MDFDRLSTVLNESIPWFRRLTHGELKEDDDRGALRAPILVREAHPALNSFYNARVYSSPDRLRSLIGHLQLAHSTPAANGCPFPEQSTRPCALVPTGPKAHATPDKGTLKLMRRAWRKRPYRRDPHPEAITVPQM